MGNCEWAIVNGELSIGKEQEPRNKNQESRANALKTKDREWAMVNGELSINSQYANTPIRQRIPPQPPKGGEE